MLCVSRNIVRRFVIYKGVVAAFDPFATSILSCAYQQEYTLYLQDLRPSSRDTAVDTFETNLPADTKQLPRAVVQLCLSNLPSPPVPSSFAKRETIAPRNVAESTPLIAPTHRFRPEEHRAHIAKPTPTQVDVCGHSKNILSISAVAWPAMSQ